MSNKLIEGASYPARRSEAIAVNESALGAVMVYIPYTLVGVVYTGIQSVCIGTKDGVLQEKQIATLREVFPGWTSENPFELQRLPLPEGDAAEFKLADYQNEPYEKNGVTVDSWKFKWLNTLGSGLKYSTETDEQKVLSKWGKKFGVAAAPAAKVETKTATAEVVSEKSKTPARKTPAKKAARTSSAKEVFELLVKSKYPNGATEQQSEDLGNDVWFPALDEVLGQGATEGTPEQWGQVADKLGV